MVKPTRKMKIQTIHAGDLISKVSHFNNRLDKLSQQASEIDEKSIIFRLQAPKNKIKKRVHHSKSNSGSKLTTFKHDDPIANFSHHYHTDIFGAIDGKKEGIEGRAQMRVGRKNLLR